MSEFVSGGGRSAGHLGGTPQFEYDGSEDSKQIVEQS